LAARLRAKRPSRTSKGGAATLRKVADRRNDFGIRELTLPWLEFLRTSGSHDVALWASYILTELILTTNSTDHGCDTTASLGSWLQNSGLLV
jgi:hypothetical protein